MTAYFDIIKFVFFILTMLVALFQLRIKWIISSDIVNKIWPFIMPIYLIILWIIIWYVIWYILQAKEETKEWKEKQYLNWFIIGWIIWIILSAIYYFIAPKLW